ncbi:MAG: ATP-binding protein [Mariprofundaceae bacterium]|nr:ATP-binding protein [Mariprofundaceae bacterium]
MDTTHRTLQSALTRTILIWASVFFVLLGIIFLLTFDDVRSYTLQKVADHRLNYQTAEFAKHMRSQDATSISEESDALVQDPEVAGLMLVDASGTLLHSSIHNDQISQQSFSKLTASNLLDTVQKTPHLHLYQSNIPYSGAKLLLVLDDRPITRAIQTSTAVSGLLLLILLALSMLALHRVLRAQLINPLLQLRGMISSGEALPDKMIKQMEHSLPREAGEILETYDTLVHAEHDMAQRFHNMLDRVPGCVWAASGSLKYSDVSSRAPLVFGRLAKEVNGAELWSWLPDEKQRKKNLKRIRKAIKAGTPSLELAYAISVDGSEQWFGENIYLHFETDASLKQVLHGVFGISNDITRRKVGELRIQSMAQHAQKMETVGTLVGGIAHEFNNMLAGIIGNIFLLKMDVEKGTKSAERLDRIERLGNRAAGLVAQLLAFGRKHRLSVKDVELVPLLNQVESIESAELPAHISLGIDIKMDGADANPVVLADPAMFRQALGSLISNAADACRHREAGEIKLIVRHVRDDSSLFKRLPQLKGKDIVCLCISDNGSGIPDDLLPRVFDPFFTTKEVGQGTGMGLSMVYGLMGGFGGAVELESEKDKGTSVHLYLQQGESVPENSETQETVLQLQFGKGETVLVADDESLLRVAASEMLEKLNYRPVVVEDGAAALNYIREHKDEVSIALLDLIMPGMGGAHAAGEIRKLSPELPIIFVTGYNLSATGSKDLQLPDSRIVTKPYAIAYLSKVMNEMLHPDE